MTLTYVCSVCFPPNVPSQTNSPLYSTRSSQSPEPLGARGLTEGRLNFEAVRPSARFMRPSLRCSSVPPLLLLSPSLPAPSTRDRNSGSSSCATLNARLPRMRSQPCATSPPDGLGASSATTDHGTATTFLCTMQHFTVPFHSYRTVSGENPTAAREPA